MNYQNAYELLPKEIVHILQQYTQGTILYIPKKTEARLPWGTNTESKALTRQRNTAIYEAYKSGQSTRELAGQYYLDIKTIQRIIRKMNNQ